MYTDSVEDAAAVVPGEAPVCGRHRRRQRGRRPARRRRRPLLRRRRRRLSLDPGDIKYYFTGMVPGLRDPAFRISLATGSDSRNLDPTFWTINMKLYHSNLLHVYVPVILNESQPPNSVLFTQHKNEHEYLSNLPGNVVDGVVQQRSHRVQLYELQMVLQDHSDCPICTMIVNKRTLGYICPKRNLAKLRQFNLLTLKVLKESNDWRPSLACCSPDCTKSLTDLRSFACLKTNTKCLRCLFLLSLPSLKGWVLGCVIPRPLSPPGRPRERVHAT